MPVETAPRLPPTDHVPGPYDGPPKAELLAERREHGHPALFTLYSEPLLIVEGRGQYLWDETGKRYLDLLAGIATVGCGHGHPKILAAVKGQLDRLQHSTTIYLHPNLPRLARALADRLPAGLDVTYFTNSGSEANELAVAMARLYTGNEDVIALRNGYHGGTSLAMGLTSLANWKFDLPCAGRILHAACPDPYRSAYSGTPEEIARKSVDEIRDLIRFSTSGGVAGFLAEPIQGVGGVTHGASNYLPLAYEVIREYGGVCIADEVQTGFGRTGEHFWGFESFGVVPDIVTMAKAIGNGFPLGAVTTRSEIARALTGRLHFNTFGGNPVAMAAGLAVLDVIDEEGLQENARTQGKRFAQGLRSLQERHRLIGDVRGMGLMIGVELVRDRSTKEPAAGEVGEVLEATREMGVLMGKGGFHGNVLRIKPPLCITRADADVALEVLDLALAQVAGGG